MTIQEKKQLVKEATVHAVPSVMDLVFGCVVKHTQHGWKQRIISNLDFNSHGRYLTDGTGAGTNIIKLPSKKWEIIGRPITLADVLIAMKTQRVRINLSGVDELYFDVLEESNAFTHEQSWKSSGVKWKLGEDFDHQSEVTIDFLWSLLCE